jgi:Succinyl-CoA synthetase, beta subunit
VPRKSFCYLTIQGINILIYFQAAEEIKKLWKLFQSVDALQMEINPFAETDKGEVISVDANLHFDDNAQFRQSKIFSQEDVSETDPREVEAARAKLNYIPMSGNIGCLGLYTATYVLLFYLFFNITVNSFSNFLNGFLCLVAVVVFHFFLHMLILLYLTFLYRIMGLIPKSYTGCLYNTA